MESWFRDFIWVLYLGGWWRDLSAVFDNFLDEVWFCQSFEEDIDLFLGYEWLKCVSFFQIKIKIKLFGFESL